ncbi:unnamed protein product [Chironomus riparius]|uniref:Uncharacterized protein n=1 Tax=Chironomus riparius TaxID=315576 RepID=A0A9N9S5A9_9DIPT|nr:unnamed protein product [Chironomus riparius]
MAPNTDGISFMDKNIEIMLIIAAVIFSIILITTIVYAVKFRTVNSAIRTEDGHNDPPQPSTSKYEPLSPNAIRFDSMPSVVHSSAFLTIPAITRTYDISNLK